MTQCSLRRRPALSEQRLPEPVGDAQGGVKVRGFGRETLLGALEKNKYSPALHHELAGGYSTRALQFPDADAFHADCVGSRSHAARKSPPIAPFRSCRADATMVGAGIPARPANFPPPVPNLPFFHLDIAEVRALGYACLRMAEPVLPNVNDPRSAIHRVERRTDRAAVPPCERCAREHVHVATRTAYVLYVRCADCGHVWSLPKPNVTQL